VFVEMILRQMSLAGTILQTFEVENAYIASNGNCSRIILFGFVFIITLDTTPF